MLIEAAKAMVCGPRRAALAPVPACVHECMRENEHLGCCGLGGALGDLKGGGLEIVGCVCNVPLNPACELIAAQRAGLLCTAYVQP